MKMEAVDDNEVKASPVSSGNQITKSQEQSGALDLCSPSAITQELGSMTLKQPAPSRLMNTAWCQCANCMSLPTERESLCCREIEKCKGLLEGRGCITEHPIFKLYCQDETVIRVMLCLVHRFPPPEAEKNWYTRKICYRSFSAWIYGFRDECHDRPIPACVVQKVRSSFPSIPNVFRGFRFTGDPPAEDIAWD